MCQRNIGARAAATAGPNHGGEGVEAGALKCNEERIVVATKYAMKQR